MKNTRPVSWIKAARDDFGEFPENVRRDMFTALTVAAEGEKSGRAQTIQRDGRRRVSKGIRYHGDAFRVIYAVKIDNDIRVIHAFQKKSKTGIKTPHMEIDLMRQRLKLLGEALQ